MYGWTGLTGDVVHQKCDNTKAAVLIFVRTLSAFFTDSCHDAEFLAQFPCKTLLWSFSFLDLASWKLPETRKSLPRRSACKQNRTVLSNDRSRNNSFPVHSPRG